MNRTHDQIKTSELMKCELPYLSKIFYSYEYPWQLLPEALFCNADIQQNGLSCILRSGIKDMTKLPEGQCTGHICPYCCSLDPSIVR